MAKAADLLMNRIASVKEGRLRASAPGDAIRSLEEFVSDCDLIMSRVYSVSYTQVAEFIHPNMEAAKSAFDNGQSPMDFVGMTAKQHGLAANVDIERNGGNARNYNLVAAAISEFVGTEQSAGWERREGGAVVYPLADGFLALRPVKQTNGEEYAFAISKHEGGELSEDGYGILDNGAVAEEFASMDLADTIERFEQEYKGSRFNY